MSYIFQAFACRFILHILNDCMTLEKQKKRYLYFYIDKLGLFLHVFVAQSAVEFVFSSHVWIRNALSIEYSILVPGDIQMSIFFIVLFNEKTSLEMSHTRIAPHRTLYIRGPLNLFSLKEDPLCGQIYVCPRLS